MPSSLRASASSIPISSSTKRSRPSGPSRRPTLRPCSSASATSATAAWRGSRRALGLAERVRFLGRQPAADYADLIAATDVGVNLRRPPTNGETSAALLDLLATGVATIVTDVATFADYPDTVVRKVRWDDARGPEELRRALVSLAGDRTTRQELGSAAQAYVRQHHAWPNSAAAYVELIERCRRPPSPHHPAARRGGRSPAFRRLGRGPIMKSWLEAHAPPAGSQDRRPDHPAPRGGGPAGGRRRARTRDPSRQSTPQGRRCATVVTEPRTSSPTCGGRPRRTRCCSTAWSASWSECRRSSKRSSRLAPLEEEPETERLMIG